MGSTSKKAPRRKVAFEARNKAPTAVAVLRLLSIRLPHFAHRAISKNLPRQSPHSSLSCGRRASHPKLGHAFLTGQGSCFHAGTNFAQKLGAAEYATFPRYTHRHAYQTVVTLNASPTTIRNLS